ncbi:MAG: tripartite tricarboxylate transporter permease [Oscillospiraceae bacterium]|nr:tripartite tricarboxylate transporter permease [Oscillospiraceae bacterium]
MGTYVLQAFATVLQPLNLVCLIGATFVGLMVGMLPGLTSTMAVALLTGLSFGLPSQTALVILISVYVGAISGGCQSAILLNIPGTPASASTALDGYPLGRQGKAGLAIFLATSASFLGTVISVLLLMTVTPLLSSLALKFGTYEYFMLALFGIIICGSITSNGKPLRGWISGILGLMVAMIGLDTISAFPRFSYGITKLNGGIQLIPVMIGLFGFPELLRMFDRKSKSEVSKMSRFNMREGFSILRRNIVNVIRSALIGVGVGIIPGVGEDIGGWLSYWALKSSTPEEKKATYGTGNPDGIVACETGNNSCVGGALIPVLSLAVPGSSSAAVLLAAFQLHGYRPGPLLMTETPALLYNLCIYMLVASFAMWALALLISKFTVRVLGVKREILMPIILALCVVGSFVVRNYMFDVQCMFIFGIVGYFMSKLEFPAAPFMLGIILGNMADSNLRRALGLSKGSLMPFVTRPICLVFFIAVVGLILSQLGVFKKVRKLFDKKSKASN